MEQKIRDFTSIVEGVLRGQGPEAAKRTMAEITRLLGIG
jgi:hypothetical protein